MTRLTKGMREDILEDLLRHRFSGELEALIKDYADFAESIYKNIYDDETRLKMDALPEGWLPESERIMVNFETAGVGVREFHFGGLIYERDLFLIRSPSNQNKSTAWKRILQKDKSRCIRGYHAKHELSLVAESLDNSRKDLVERVRAAKKKAETALNSVSTVKRLIEIWPEIKPFAAEYISEEGNKLPAVQTDKLNEAFNLPVEEKL